MKAAILGALMLIGSFAQAREYSRGELGLATNLDNKTCAEAQAFVQDHGYYVRYSLDGPLKIVLNGDALSCGIKRPAPVWQPTVDAAECVVGYICRSGN